MQTSTVSAMRSAGVILGGLGGVLFVAIGVGAVTARLAPPDAMLIVAVSVTAASALLSGLVAGPVVRRLLRRLHVETQADATAPVPPTGDSADGTSPAQQ
ncbi:hypothetical protein [Amycolatopsis sp. NPDC051061]|uniref:hypothetical protein n=1 Tax=Amycolatopsis sp. NPDC051061 TaxID=3155042 RepID=UPI0034481CB6